MRLFLPLISILFSSNLQAANWAYVLSTESTPVYIDTSSISIKGKYRKAWFYWEYSQPQKQNSYSQDEYDVSKRLFFFHCAERTMATAQSIQSLKGKPVNAHATQFPEMEFSEVAPESIGEVMLNKVCSAHIKK